MVLAANLGYPRIGEKRQLKTAVESFWSGKSTESELGNAARQLRMEAWTVQRDAGIDYIPSNDFSYYDHVLDTIAMVGAVPARFRWNGENIGLSEYFLMARGTTLDTVVNGQPLSAAAMEMTKWFNTNYHYIVPELDPGQELKLSSNKCIDEFLEAKEAGIITRPVLLSPITFVQLAKMRGGNDKLRLVLDKVVSVYMQVLKLLKDAGAQAVQIDEPILSLDLEELDRNVFTEVYSKLASAGLELALTSYFGPMRDNLQIALNLPVQSIHLDLVYGQADLDEALNGLPKDMKLSAGVVDGRNIWKCHLGRTSELLANIAERIGPERLIIAPSCSLLHVPVDVMLEDELEPEVRSWLSFAKQKLQEISLLADDLCCGRTEVEELFKQNSDALAQRDSSELRNDSVVRGRVHDVTDDMCKRANPYPVRSEVQRAHLNLPLFPTTTIGSFPQTSDIRNARKAWRAGKIADTEYKESMQREIENNVAIQEKLGIDVFVHGEPERTDMVEYFAEQLPGMAVTKHGWVQSYGSRCVRPPIIYGDISRPLPMTVDWIRYAQERASKPMKGMLTGPVTMLQWSFVRDDQPREVTCTQLALAIRDEVADLEAAEVSIIQIDEPAIREGLPLRKDEWQHYLDWAVRCFRLCSSTVEDRTQIHTHMCYSEFGVMCQSIADMDADVISIEAAKSQMDLLDALRESEYPNEIGPGVYDIHSPRIPDAAEMNSLLKKALKVIPAERLWVNPDCGLKTRTWKEVEPALSEMVQAALTMRTSFVVAASAKRN